MRLVGRVVQDLYLKQLSRIPHLQSLFQQSLHDELLVVDRQLDEDVAGYAAGRRLGILSGSPVVAQDQPEAVATRVQSFILQQDASSGKSP